MDIAENLVHQEDNGSAQVEEGGRGVEDPAGVGEDDVEAGAVDRRRHLPVGRLEASPAAPVGEKLLRRREEAGPRGRRGRPGEDADRGDRSLGGEELALRPLRDEELKMVSSGEPAQDHDQRSERAPGREVVEDGDPKPAHG